VAEVAFPEAYVVAAEPEEEPEAEAETEALLLDPV